MKYYIAPRSGERSYKNFQSTIKHGVPYENIEPYLADEGKSLLLAEDVIYSWGNRAGTRSQWESMQYGDTVIFYAKGELVMAGEVYYKQQSPGLALAMWPPDEKGNPWEYTFFLRNLKYFKMPMRAFNWAAGFKHNYVVQGFTPLKPERVAAIEKDYGSIEGLLSIFNTSASSEIPTAKEKLYVNVPQNLNITVRDSNAFLPKAQFDQVTPRTTKSKKIDYEASNKAKAITGSKGEAIAVQFEQDRLINLGRKDLAKMVKRISMDDDSVGYDISSFEVDGSERFIEVKTTSQSGGGMRFYMSANEMRKSKNTPNYYVYFVDQLNTASPRITTIECPLNNRFSITPDTYLLEAEII